MHGSGRVCAQTANYSKHGTLPERTALEESRAQTAGEARSVRARETTSLCVRCLRLSSYVRYMNCRPVAFTGSHLLAASTMQWHTFVSYFYSQKLQLPNRSLSTVATRLDSAPKKPSFTWHGSVMSCLIKGDCSNPRGVALLESWVNEIHRWDLTKHAQSVQRDVKAILDHSGIYASAPVTKGGERDGKKESDGVGWSCAFSNLRILSMLQRKEPIRYRLWGPKMAPKACT